LLSSGGRAAGVEADWVDPALARSGAGAASTLTVRAPTVVVAAGAVNSPALLLRSELGGPAVGEYLRLHPTVAVTGYYESRQRWMWDRRRRRCRTSSPTPATAMAS
jgi:choline dehydrogenase-like flavoprotein